MEVRGKGRAETSTYTAEQVESTLKAVGVKVESETFTDYISFCPYHNNSYTPSFATSKDTGLSFCFNPACNANPNLVDLVRHAGRMTHFQALRLIQKSEMTAGEFRQKLQTALLEKPRYVEFSQDILDARREDFWKNKDAINYMYSRKFTDETLKYFDIGYSAKKDLIMVPMHSPDGMPVGVIGRRPSKTDKTFKNSVGLPSKTTVWNFHRAKREGDTVVICEASFDAMRIHQAGYPNVVALLMGYFSEHHQQLLDRTFSKIIIMTDNDEPQFYTPCRKCSANASNLCIGHRPGEVLGEKIADKLYSKRIYWANFGNTRFPEGCKDPGDMNDDQIRACIRGAVSNFEYRMLYK